MRRVLPTRDGERQCLARVGECFVIPNGSDPCQALSVFAETLVFSYLSLSSRFCFVGIIRIIHSKNARMERPPILLLAPTLPRSGIGVKISTVQASAGDFSPQRDGTFTPGDLFAVIFNSSRGHGTFRDGRVLCGI